VSNFGPSPVLVDKSRTHEVDARKIQRRIVPRINLQIASQRAAELRQWRRLGLGRKQTETINMDQTQLYFYVADKLVNIRDMNES
jgi:hypothetical protein